MTVKIIGLDDLIKALEAVGVNVEDPELITKALAGLMREYVHIDSAYLQSTIDYSANAAGASADYAGYEADRGGDHDYAMLAIDAFDMEVYSNQVVEPF